METSNKNYDSQYDKDVDLNNFLPRLIVHLKKK